MLSVVFSLRKNRCYLQRAEHKTTIFSDYQNLTYYLLVAGQMILTSIIFNYYTTNVPPMPKRTYFPGVRHSPLEKGV